MISNSLKSATAPCTTNLLKKGNNHSLLGLVAAQQRAKQSQRMGDFDSLHNRAILTQLLLMGELQHCVLTMRSEIKEAGLYRQNMKMLCRKMETISSQMQSEILRVGEDASQDFCRQLLPGYEKEYIASGGNIFPLAQLNFSSMVKDDMMRLYVASKQILDNMKHPHASVGARILVACGVAEFYWNVSDSFRYIIFQATGKKCRLLSSESIKGVRSAGVEILASFVKQQIDEQSGMNARKALDVLTSVVTGTEMGETLEKAQKRFQIEYIEFFIASIRLGLEEKKLPFTAIRSLYYFFAEKKYITEFLTEVGAISIIDEEYEVMDAFSLSLEMVTLHSPRMDEFRHMAFNGRRRHKDVDFKQLQLEQLKREINENEGILPLGSLKQLYQEHSTKKAVEEMVKALGPDGNATLKLLKQTKVKDLAA